MLFPRYLPRLFLLLIICKIITPELARMRLSGGHIVTSSTLKWVSGTSVIPQHAISVTENDVPMIWCRVKQHGIYVGGALSSGVCKAPFLEQVFAVSEGYEVLVSINGSSRLKRVEWDKYNAPPKKSIASSEKQQQYLAFHVDENGFTYAGYLLPNERRVHLVDGDKVRKEDEAFVLVEDEPQSYDLRTILLDESHTLTSMNEIVMKQLTLVNEGANIASVTETVDIITKHLVYWGQVKGTLIGRKAFVIGPNPERGEREITWGVQNEFDQVYSYEIEYELDPETASEVKIIGIFRKIEAPYVGTLTATYKDGSRLSRTIEGLHIDERLLELKAVYSTPIFTQNNTRLEIDERVDILYKLTTTTTTTSPFSENPWISTNLPELQTDEPERPQNETEVELNGKAFSLINGFGDQLWLLLISLITIGHNLIVSTR